MKPIIGIICKDDISKMGHKTNIMYYNIIKCIIKSKGIPIGIPNDNLLPYLDICQGFIFQGGDDISNHDLKNIKILQQKNIPTLGICLGMQEMAIANQGKLYNLKNHKNNDLHAITIDKHSLLYKIINHDKTIVNSRHKSAVKYTNLSISSKAFDNTIESVEDPTKKFFLGLEWHPENMYDYDINSRKIFDYFIKICND